MLIIICIWINLEKRRRGLKRRHDELTSPPPTVGDKSTAVDHVFAVPKAPSPVPRARRKAGLRPQKRETKSAEPLETEEVRQFFLLIVFF